MNNYTVLPCKTVSFVSIMRPDTSPWALVFSGDAPDARKRKIHDVARYHFDCPVVIAHLRMQALQYRMGSIKGDGFGLNPQRGRIESLRVEFSVACGVVFFVGWIKRVARIHRNRRWIHAFGVLSTLPPNTLPLAAGRFICFCTLNYAASLSFQLKENTE